MPRGIGYRWKPAIRTVNHCENAPAATTGGTTRQLAVFNCTDAPANRGANIPEGAILKSVWIKMWATDATPVAGKHQCLMLKQPGGTTYSDPIAAYYSTTDPLTEEAIQVRQNRMSRPGVETRVTVTGASGPPIFLCTWRGNWSMRDGDDVVICNLDTAATTWVYDCRAAWIA